MAVAAQAIRLESAGLESNQRPRDYEAFVSRSNGVLGRPTVSGQFSNFSMYIGRIASVDSQIKTNILALGNVVFEFP